MTNRITFFDYARGLAIILVVFTHIGFDWLNEIILFCMPLFFVTSGYLYSGKRSYWQTVKVSFKKLMIPFYAATFVYLLVELYRSAYFQYLSSEQVVRPILYNGIYGSGILPGMTEGLRALGRELCHKAQATPSVDVIMPTTCHLWFLPAMFSGMVIFAALADRAKSAAARLVVVALLVAAAAVEVVFPAVKHLPLSMGRGFIAAAWMFAGLWFREINLFESKNRGAIVAISFIGMLVSFYFGSSGSAMVASYYGPHGAASVAMTYIGGLAAVVFVLFVCQWFDSLPLDTVKSALELVGNSTMMIYLWHMLPKTALEIAYAKIIGEVPKLDGFYMGLIPAQAGGYMVFEGVVIIGLFWAIARWRKAKAGK